jgi:hypothetical protein
MSHVLNYIFTFVIINIMLNKVLPPLILLVAASFATQCAAADKIAFAYQIVRHGARAPVSPEPNGFFQVPKEQLAASGMRQRQLLGRYNRFKYVDRSDLLDPVYNPN